MDVKVVSSVNVRRDSRKNKKRWHSYALGLLLPTPLSLYEHSPPPDQIALGLPPPPLESVGEDGRAYATIFFGLTGLPKILTHGAPLARFAR